jgi:DnaK suppressor protein
MATQRKSKKAKPVKKAKAPAKPVRKAASAAKKPGKPAKKPAQARPAKAPPAKGAKPKASKEKKRSTRAPVPSPANGGRDASVERVAASRPAAIPPGPSNQTVFPLMNRPGEDSGANEIVLTRDARKKMAHIDDPTLAKIVTKLDEMRIESQGVVRQHVTNDLEQHKGVSDVGDDVDQAVTERDREFDLIRHQRDLRRLQQVTDAFQRLQEGSYGFCEGTEEPINPKRLLIVPLARFSLEYQEQQEKMLGRSPEDALVGGEESLAAEE